MSEKRLVNLENILEVEEVVGNFLNEFKLVSYNVNFNVIDEKWSINMINNFVHENQELLTILHSIVKRTLKIPSYFSYKYFKDFSLNINEKSNVLVFKVEVTSNYEMNSSEFISQFIKNSVKSYFKRIINDFNYLVDISNIS